MEQKYTLINDVPSTSDDFQSHKKIADSLYQIVTSNKGGKTIGLEGKWGSGKSSIINILQKRIEAKKGDGQKKHRFFSFDSWAHQEDPLRRSFLEELINKALERNWFEGDNAAYFAVKWERKKGELSRKIKETNKTVDPVITTFGKAMFVSLLLCPISVSVLLAILNKYPDQIGFNSWPITFAEAVLIAGFMFATGPLVVFLANWFLNRKDIDRARVWAVFLNKGYVEEQFVVSESLDRSTIEFQAMFKELMEDILVGNDRRLVIILDNLDRLSIEEVQSVWPMLRSFIDTPQFSGESWFDRLWVIVPHDRQALEKKAPENHALSLDMTTVQSKHIEGTSFHFLDKVFQLKVFVPAPVLSNWRVYLQKNLKTAFKSEADASAHAIYLLLTRWYGFSTPPGPREIITIINGMVATKTLWGDKGAAASIRLEHHAYFSILKRERSITDLRTRLLNKTIDLHEDLLGAGIEDSLFALETNIQPEEAKQILYRPLIEEMLMTEGAHTQLMTKYHQPGFAAVFDMCIGEILAVNSLTNPPLYLQIVQCILGSQFFIQRSKIQKIGLLKAVDNSLKKFGQLPFDLPEVMQFLNTLAKCDGEHSILKSTIRQLLQKNASEYFLNNRFNTQTMQTAHAIWSAEVLQVYLEERITKFMLPTVVNDFIDNLIELKKSDYSNILEAFEISEMSGEIAASLSHKDAIHLSWQRISHGIQFIEHSGNAVPREVFNNLAMRILNTDSTRPSDLAEVLPYLLEKSKTNQYATDAVAKLYGSIALDTHLETYHPSSDLDESLDYMDKLHWHAANKRQICGRLFYLISKNYPRKLNENKYSYLFHNKKPDMEILEGLREVWLELPDPEGYVKYLETNNMAPLATFLKTGELKRGVPLMTIDQA